MPRLKGAVRVTANNYRRFVEAVLYRYRAGLYWRGLPERFGQFRKVHTRFRRWPDGGMRASVQVLAADADNEYAMTDATIARTH